jgi:hypothetical protein
MVCKEIEWRTPKDDVGVSYARDFMSYTSAIVSLLKYHKRKMEEEYKEKKMKVVINKCYGGFGLSLKAQKEYLKLIGKEAFFYAKDYKAKTYTRIEDLDGSCIFSYTLTKDFGDSFGELSSDNYDKYGFYDGNIERDDPNLVAVVEKLGDESSGDCGSLRVVEIPDDIEWEIDEYDGMESIEEKHRSWE